MACILLLMAGCTGGGETGKERAGKIEPKQENQAKQMNNTQHSAGRDMPNPTANKRKNNRILLNVPLIRQNPELKYGCEVTSLAMVLRYAGVKADKMSLANQIKKEIDPLKKTTAGDITGWGDPADGFVGDMTGRKPGYAVYDREIAALLDRYMPGRANNLTGSSFDRVLEQVEAGRPVVVWTTGDYRLPDRWEKWKHKGETIKTPLDLHAVVLVGFDAGHVYVNDPLSGIKKKQVERKQFEASWRALKKRAVTYRG